VGETVIAVGRGPRRGELARPPGSGSAGPIEYVELDLAARPESLRELIEQSAGSGVIHCAAMTDVDACERDPEQAWAVNVRATEQAALGCRRAGARLLALSTDYVFDGDAGRPYSEDDVPNPRGAYARSKRAGEDAALLLGRDVAVGRVAVVYSGRPGTKRTFASAAAEALSAGREVKAFHDQVVSPTLADDAAAMAIGLFRSGEQGVWHCAGSSVVARVDFCLALARKLGADERLVVPVPLASAKLLAPRPRCSALRVEKVRRLLGERVALDLPAQLERFAAERAG
jgi:dTDP-4-dehydrorhamnose reductase